MLVYPYECGAQELNLMLWVDPFLEHMLQTCVQVYVLSVLA